MEDINSGLVYKSQVLKIIETQRSIPECTDEAFRALVKLRKSVEQIPELEVHPIKMDLWNKYPDQKPNESGYYQCAIIIAKGKGKFTMHQEVLFYQAEYDSWECGEIVTHWKELEPNPIDGLL